MPEQHLGAPPQTGSISPPITQDLDLENMILNYKIQPRQNEEVYEIVPKHIGKVFIAVTGAVAVVIIALILLFTVLFTNTFNPAAMVVVMAIFGLIIFVGLMYSISNWVSYMASGLIVTNQRIIDVDQQHLFLKKVQETDIRLVRNILNGYSEPFGHFFHYGWVEIEQIGADPMKIRHLPLPRVMAGQIMHYHNLVVHGSIATAHNFSAQKPEDDKTPDLAHTTEAARTIAKQQGIPVKG